MGYKKLAVYERSYKAALAVHRIRERFPVKERYSMGDQIWRAAISIPMNIAEGYGKQDSTAEFKRYLRMAMGSSNEVKVLLDFAKDLEYIDLKVYERAVGEYDEIGRMLHGLIQSKVRISNN